MTTTPEPNVTEFLLCEADTPRASVQWKDSVGQLLTHTVPESPEALQRRWDEMIEQLASADVLLPPINCPPAGGADDLERFEGELQLQAGILRAALQKRRPTGPSPSASPSTSSTPASPRRTRPARR